MRLTIVGTRAGLAIVRSEDLRKILPARVEKKARSVHT